MEHLRHFVGLVQPCDVAATSNNVPNMAGMIRAGVGIGILPCMVGDIQRDLIRCFPPPKNVMTPWWIVASREANELRRVRDFMSFAADEVRHLRGALNGTLDQDAARAILETV
jgi:DNA-binding transcriptional LysR family regulator